VRRAIFDYVENGLIGLSSCVSALADARAIGAESTGEAIPATPDIGSSGCHSRVRRLAPLGRDPPNPARGATPLYGMLSANVSQRTGEIGIRVALGASRGTILKMVFADAFRLVAIGAALGSIVLFFTTGAIAHMLYGVSPFDPTTMAIACTLLVLVVVVASFTPARRAASVDPMQAMRTE
jgi:FtsX-like permease family